MRSLLRFAFHLFYNPFAFTYDFVSALVSRGQWRQWTRAAIPYIVGTRILEVPCGTGSLLLDLFVAGYQPVGVDLSAAMLGISHRKLQGVNQSPRLIRARVEQLPFPPATFDSIVMTFPPSFVFDPAALAELHRVLDAEGVFVWVDAGRLLSHGLWSRVLNGALDAVGGKEGFDQVAIKVLSRAGFECHVKMVRDEESLVKVAIATKRKMS